MFARAVWVRVSSASLRAAQTLAAAVAKLGDSAATRQWVVFFVDERMVPPTHADSNALAVEASVRAAGASVDWTVVPPDTSLATAEATAEDYERRIRAVVAAEPGQSQPAFDLVLLGMGPDGHTASLFPDHPLLARVAEDTPAVLAIHDSPKPPPVRVTLSLPAINAARRVAFVATGASKYPVLRRALAGPELPAGRVRPSNGSDVVWLVDPAAARGSA